MCFIDANGGLKATKSTAAKLPETEVISEAPELEIGLKGRRFESLGLPEFFSSFLATKLTIYCILPVVPLV